MKPVRIRLLENTKIQGKGSGCWADTKAYQREYTASS